VIVNGDVEVVDVEGEHDLALRRRRLFRPCEEGDDDCEEQ
jgi:hypothetical protein